MGSLLRGTFSAHVLRLGALYDAGAGLVRAPGDEQARVHVPDRLAATGRELVTAMCAFRGLLSLG